MTLKEWQERNAKEALLAAESLKEARLSGDQFQIGYWTAYLADRESAITILDTLDFSDN